MKRLLGFALFFLVAFNAQAQQARRTYITTTTGNDIGVNETGSAVAFHQLSWNVSGSVPTCQVRLMGSADNVTYGTTIIANQTCTSNGQSTVTTSVISNYVRIEVTTKTGAGTLTATYTGYTSAPGGGSSLTCAVSGGVIYETAANTGGCDAQFTWDNTSKFLTNTTTQAAIFSDFQGTPGAVNGIVNSTAATPSYIGVYGIGQNLAGSAITNAPFGAFFGGYNSKNTSGDTFGVNAEVFLAPPVATMAGDGWAVAADVFISGLGTVPIAHALGASSVAQDGSTVTDLIGVTSQLGSGANSSGTITNYYQYHAPSVAAGRAGTFHAAYWSGDQGSNAKDFSYYSAGGRSRLNASMGQTAGLLQLNNACGSVVDSLFSICGTALGECDGFATPCYFNINQTNQNPWNTCKHTADAPAGSYVCDALYATGKYELDVYDGTNNCGLDLDPPNFLVFLTGCGFKSPTYNTSTNCADSAGAAACGSAAAGAVVIDAGATTVVVSTTAVTANSEIFVQYDSSLGARLGITCNTTVALPAITARTAATSFTITIPVMPAVNPACYSYHIIN